MVTRSIISNVTQYHDDGTVDKKYECCGLSTDTKPHNLPNSTTFYEMDTKKVWMYDKENDNWIEQ